LHDLGVISNSYYRGWCIDLNQRGWRKQEPAPLEREKPEWLNQNVLRALSEGWMTKEEAETILGQPVDAHTPLSLTQRRAFAKLPVEERARVLHEQAAKMIDHYSGKHVAD
jgi:hypothetical protein